MKSGIWTEHQDAHGRTYYFNMVHGRSYWTLPDDLLALVQRPAPDAARAWDPVPLAHDAPLLASNSEPHKQREQEQAAQDTAASTTSTGTTAAATTSTAAAFASAAPGMAALHERMAVAAQRKKQSELKRLADEKQQQQPSDTAAPQDAYLAMVRQLEQSDKASESTGNKWLVR